MADFSDLAHTIEPDLFTSSAEYAGRFSGETGRYFLEQQERSVLSLLSGKAGSVLELGGGHLQMTPSLLERGYSVTVHASAETGLVRARELGINTTAFSISTLAETKNRYDFCVSLRLLPHVLDWRELLLGMAAVSRQGIVFDFASTAGFNALSPLLFKVKKRMEGNTRPYFLHSPSQIRAELARLGFSRVEMIHQFFLPMGLHRKLNRATLSKRLESLAQAAGLTKLFGNPVIVGAFR
jgi:2-polyprenyl-3-methyl-5-hydroxy-6-metoxy-1,4-benzoquinol methylase